MISIKDVHDLIDFVIDKSDNKPQRRTDIDLAVHEASLTLFREELDKYEEDVNNMELLSDFMNTENYTSQTTFGTFAKPSGYERYVRLTTQAGIGISVVKSHAWDSLVNHPIKVPSETHPIATIGSSILVRPTTMRISLVYFKTPTKPVYGQSGGVYSEALSTHLEWKGSVFYKIVNMALSKLGVNLKDQQLIEYSEIMKR